jgi:hypothetical protein
MRSSGHCSGCGRELLAGCASDSKPPGLQSLTAAAELCGKILARSRRMEPRQDGEKPMPFCKANLPKLARRSKQSFGCAGQRLSILH